MVFRRVVGLGVVLVSSACSPALEPEGESQQPRISDASCVCTLDQICTSGGTCVARPEPAPGEAFGQLELLRQDTPRDASITGRFAKATVSFRTYSALPVDDRQKFQVTAAEECALEIGTSYPTWYDDRSWPTGPGLGAGNVTFDVSGTGVPVALRPTERPSSGFSYSERLSPPPLSAPGISYPGLFDSELLPPAARFEVRTAGGPHVGAASVIGELPGAFDVIEPAVDVADTTVSTANGLRVAWSPPQPSAFMEISFSKTFGSTQALVTCKLIDDGSAVIPKEALAGLATASGARVAIQFRRTTERYASVRGERSTAHMFVTARRALVGQAILQSTPLDADITTTTRP